MPTTWATAADVLTYTTTTVDDDAVTRAQATIDIHAGRLPEDAERIGTRDQYWLKLAVCYQAAWLAAQPDAFERLEVTEAGGATNRTMFTELALVLAPNAKWALKRVSWLRSRSLHVRTPWETNGITRYITGEDGDYGRWVGLEG